MVKKYDNFSLLKLLLSNLYRIKGHFLHYLKLFRLGLRPFSPYLKWLMIKIFFCKQFLWIELSLCAAWYTRLTTWCTFSTPSKKCFFILNFEVILKLLGFFMLNYVLGYPKNKNSEASGLSRWCKLGRE